MGFHVAAVDVGEEKLHLARKLGAQIAVDARAEDPARKIQDEIGGAHGVLVTAVSPIASSSKPSACFVAAAHAF